MTGRGPTAAARDRQLSGSSNELPTTILREQKTNYLTAGFNSTSMSARDPGNEIGFHQHLDSTTLSSRLDHARQFLRPQISYRALWTRIRVHPEEAN